jgi:hypothetical protein
LYALVEADAVVVTLNAHVPLGSLTCAATPTLTCEAAAWRLVAHTETNSRPVRSISLGTNGNR